MLTAWDKLHELTLALPDYRNRDQLEHVRSRARVGELICPTCQQPLWLRAGDIRIPHFGHRMLNDCPQGRVSEAVLAARHYLHRFFRTRIEAGKLAADLELEPRIRDFGDNVEIDLLVHRPEKPWVAVIIVEKAPKPEIRAEIGMRLRQKKWVFRPVFLHSRLKSVPEAADEFLLDTTEREFQIRSPYDLRPQGSWGGPGTLHFIDTALQSWTTLRSLYLVHDPQVFQTRIQRHSSFHDLLWSEAHSEWAHPGEAEALKALIEAQAAEARRRAEEEERKRKALAAQRSKPRPRPTLPPRLNEVVPLAAPLVASPSIEFEEEKEGQGRYEYKGVRAALRHYPAVEKKKEELPAWMAEGLKCVGCGRMTHTLEWQNASPGQGLCVCRACFDKGVRLS